MRAKRLYPKSQSNRLEEGDGDWDNQKRRRTRRRTARPQPHCTTVTSGKTLLPCLRKGRTSAGLSRSRRRLRRKSSSSRKQMHHRLPARTMPPQPLLLLHPPALQQRPQCQRPRQQHNQWQGKSGKAKILEECSHLRLLHLRLKCLSNPRNLRRLHSPSSLLLRRNLNPL